MEKVFEVSKQIWESMQKKDIEKLMELIHPEAMFVHMSRSLTRDEEIAVISENDIVYKSIDFQEKTVNQMGTTIVLLNKLRLTAVVKGNEVTNPFVVTEVYTKNRDNFRMASLAFTKILE